MIRVRLVMPGLTGMPPPKQGPLAASAHTMWNALRRIVGFQPAPSAEARFRRKCEEVENKVKGAAQSTALLALARLRELTPQDTGDTAAKWDVKIADEGDKLDFSFTHPNPKLIKWLNYGTKMHVIYAKNAYRGGVLKFRMNGKTVFAKYVFHPGNPAYAFLERVESEFMGNLRRLQSMVKL